MLQARKCSKHCNVFFLLEHVFEMKRIFDPKDNGTTVQWMYPTTLLRRETLSKWTSPTSCQDGRYERNENRAPYGRKSYHAEKKRAFTEKKKMLRLPEQRLHGLFRVLSKEKNNREHTTREHQRAPEDVRDWKCGKRVQ